MKPNTPQWMLRRFAMRAIRVQERLGPRDPVVAAYALTIVPSAQRFIELFDQAFHATRVKSVERAQGLAAVAELLRRMRSWMAIAVARIPTLDPTIYGDRPDVPEDVIGDAERFCGVVLAHFESDPENVPFAKALVADLQPAIDNANKEWGEADDARSGHADHRTQTREAARQFEVDLVAFRTTLRHGFGSNHPEYQKLRRRRAKSKDEDDDEVSMELLDQGEDEDIEEEGE